MRHLLFLVWWVFCLFCAVAVFLSFAFSGTIAFVDYFALLPQSIYTLLFVVLSVAGFFVLYNRVYLIIPIVGVILSLVWLNDIVWLHTVTKPSDVSVVRVVNWNTAVWDESREGVYFDQLKRHTADVYLLQEVLSARAPGLEARIRRAFPEYSVSHLGEFLTLSKFPIIYSYLPLSQGFSRHDIYINNKTYTFYNVHLRVPLYGDRKERNNKYDFNLRNAQFNDLQRSLFSDRGNVFIAGDFNTTRNYSFIRILERQFEMNQPSGFLLFPKTFSTALPVIRIDYQFTNKSNDFVKYETFGGTMSDHLGIYGEIYDRN